MEDSVNENRWDHCVDLLVFGSGAAGLSAALFGEIDGLRTLVCEKTSQVGGTTATSGGIAWIPGNSHAQRAGNADTFEKARTYLKAELGSYYQTELVDAFLSTGAEAIDRLEKNSEVKFALTTWPDYHPDQPGAALQGRTIEAKGFDGRILRESFFLLRRPIPALVLFGGMQVDKRRVDDFLRPFKSLRSLLRVTSSIIRYAIDRVHYPYGTILRGGNALAGALLSSLISRNAEIWTKAELIQLKQTKGRVVGALVHRDGKIVNVKATCGVVLATGGFPQGKELRNEYCRSFPHDYSFGFEANVGAGILAAREIGAAVEKDVASPAYWQPSSISRSPDGSAEPNIYGYLDRGRPGVIAVDRSGKRFVNEANSYHDIGLALFKNGLAKGNRFHFICDSNFVWHHGLGKIRPFERDIERFVRDGYVVKADTVEELAMRTGIETDGLANTLERYNGFCKSGLDSDFGKGSTAYNKLFGHERAAPNSNLAPIERAPFFALEIHPSTIGTAIGLKVNKDSQVLNAKGKILDGLFACGNDAVALMRGLYPAGGITIGPAITFAYRAVKRAITSTTERAPKRPPPPQLPFEHRFPLIPYI